MNTDELRDNANLYSDTAFEIKKQHLYAQIKKALERCESAIEDLELSGNNKTFEGKKEYSALKHLLKCYSNLFNSDIDTQKDYDEVEWMFNGGRLRTKEEINKLIEAKEQEKYYNEIYLPKKLALSKLQDDVSNLTTWGGVALGLSIVGWFIFWRDSSGFFVWNINDASATYSLLWIFTIPVGMLISKGIGLIIDAIIEAKLQKMAKKAGDKKHISTSLLADAAMLGVAGLNIRNIFKKGKK